MAMIAPAEISQYENPFPTEEGYNAQPNPTGTGNPGASDDETEGYEVFSLWRNDATDEVFLCLDNTDSAAVWTKITTPNLDVETSDATTTGTSGEDLYSYSLPAGTLEKNGYTLEGIYFGSLAANGNDKILWVEIDGTDCGPAFSSSGNNKGWSLSFFAVRVSDTELRVVTRYEDGDGSVEVTYTSVTTSDLDTNAINVKLRGRTTTQAGDLTARGGRVRMSIT